MNSPWQPFHEPLRTTLLRTGALALAGGALLAHWMGGLTRWPLATLFVLWFSFGGHWVELFFLNALRPRLPAARRVQVAARLAVWFAGGTILGLGIAFTAMLAAYPGRRIAWWLAGAAFVVVELLVHLGAQMRGRPNFYDGRG
jgi:hypothetical protein